PTRLLLNEVGNRRNWIITQLEGAKSSYCSASDARVHFGLGSDQQADAIVVEWPGGSKESGATPEINQHITLRQGTGTTAD
ncbi:MAG: hypothetical protein GY767_02950, partial [Shimia sp.]|nr:hypothetical protein [Shimia sp.]